MLLLSLNVKVWADVFVALAAKIFNDASMHTSDRTDDLYDLYDLLPRHDLDISG